MTVHILFPKTFFNVVEAHLFPIGPPYLDIQCDLPMPRT
jgi:hypothetical protein